MVDAALCVLVALRWRLRPRQASLLLGDLICGYMVLPASPAVRERLVIAARKCSVRVDGILPVQSSGSGFWRRHLNASVGAYGVDAALAAHGSFVPGTEPARAAVMPVWAFELEHVRFELNLGVPARSNF